MVSSPATANDEVQAGRQLLRDGDEESKLDPITKQQVFAPKSNDKLISPDQSAIKAKPSSSVLSKRKYGKTAMANPIELNQADAADCQSEYLPKFRQPKASSVTQKPLFKSKETVHC